MSTECGGNLSKRKTSLWLGAAATMLASLAVVPVTPVHAASPTVSSLSFTSSAGGDNTYIAGDVISVTVVFSESVDVTG
ncbi:MAG: hypothetical protein WC864_09880, partial [Ilumatobacteraceae bacterium]